MASDPKLDEYMRWAREELGIRRGADIACVVVDAEKQERGLIARQAIDEVPQELLNVPFESLLTILSIPPEWQQQIPFFDVSSRINSSSSDEEEEERENHAREWTYQDQEDDQLALLLLYERFIRGSNSKWHLHLQHLPTQYHNLLFFTENELECLRGSNLFFVAQDLQQQIVRHFERLQLQVLPELMDLLTTRDLTDGDESLAKIFSIENYRWALSTIWSRFVTMEYEYEEEEEDSDYGAIKGCVLKAMVPVFDFFNHHVDAQVTHFYDYQTKSFRLISHQPWSAMQQLYLSYGTLSNHKLLTLYGFVDVPEKAHDHDHETELDVANGFDCIELWIPIHELLPPEHVSVHNKTKTLLFLQQFLHEYSSQPCCDVNQCRFELTLDQVNPMLLQVLRIATIQGDNFQQFEQQAMSFWCSQPDDSDHEQEPHDEPKLLPLVQEQQLLNRLARWLEQMLQGLLIQCETNRQVHQAHESSVTLYHCQLAQRILHSDANVIRANLDMLNTAIQGLQNQ